MNRVCFSQNKTELASSTKLNLPVQNNQASCVRPQKNKFVRMKHTILFVYLMAFAGIVFAQSPVDKLFDKYGSKDGYTTVVITQYMFDMFKDVNTNDKDFDGLVKGLKSIRILAVDKENPKNSAVNFYKEIMKDLPTSEYNELMVIKQKDQDVKFLVKEVQGRIVEFLLISGGKDNAFISIQGNIDLKSLAKLSKNMNIQGLKSLENVNTAPPKK
jgi:hypothetical protein